MMKQTMPKFLIEREIPGAGQLSGNEEMVLVHAA